MQRSGRAAMIGPGVLDQAVVLLDRGDLQCRGVKHLGTAAFQGLDQVLRAAVRGDADRKRSKGRSRRSRCSSFGAVRRARRSTVLLRVRRAPERLRRRRSMGSWASSRLHQRGGQRSRSASASALPALASATRTTSPITSTAGLLHPAAAEVMVPRSAMVVRWPGR